ncbi:aminoglycoside phosphotransferase, partial [Bifidobacterium longum]|nr:aminoglycoside phosphotransferase [Bifidobacterium longum]
STITVGTLLQDDRHQAPAQPQQSDTGTAAAEVSDDTPDPDRTGSADIVAAGDVDLTPEVEPDADRTANHPQANVSGIATGTGSTKPQPSHGASHSSVTITLKELLSMNGHSGTTSTDASPASQSAAPTDDAVNDDTPDSLVQYGASSAQTTVIPLLEREERALRDARAGLDGYDSEGNPLAESSTSSK